MKDKTSMKPAVLERLRKHGNVSRAAREVGINRRTIARWKINDGVFRAAANQAITEFCS